MPKIFSSLSLRRPLRWFRKAPSGSVLILVVALIVILALLGTAFVATARIDRISGGGANASATIMNAQLQSLQTEICTDITNGLYDQSTGTPIYRPISNNPVLTAALFGATTLNSPTYGHFDSNRWTSTAGSINGIADPNEWDTWLADRLPATYVDNPTNPTYTNIIWRSVTRLPGRITLTSNLTTPMALPALPLTPPPVYDPWGKNSNGTTVMSLVPTAIAITYPRSTSESFPNTPKVYPAFMPQTVTSGPPIYGTPFLAADADGDGIADSLLFPLNVTSSSSSGTVTYYAAVRIVDNNSAVNLNTAWSRFSDFQITTTFASPSSATTPPKAVDALGALWTATTGAANLGWFPSHVGLQEMLDPTEPAVEMQRLNFTRFNNSGISNKPIDDATTAGASPTFTIRSDYQFITFGDALWNQLGRRLQYPGYSTTNLKIARYQPVNDNGELAFRFNLIDPSANPNPQTSTTFATAVTDIAQSAPSVPEQEMLLSLYTDAINWTQFPTYNRWSVYPADKALYWFDYNFNNNSFAGATAGLNSANGASSHDNESANASSVTSALFPRNVRPEVVTSNPVSNAAPIHSFGVAVASVQQDTRRLVPVPPPSNLAISTWTQQYMAPYTNSVTPNSPAAASPIRASLNTDQFPVLWRAFWNVMCDDNNAGSIPLVPGTANPSAAMTQIYTDPPDQLLTIPPATPAWSQYDQLLIRSAIAAVNVEGLRDQTDNVISRHIILPDQVDVEVFSNKPQPYILSYSDGSTTPAGVTLCNPMSVKTLGPTSGTYQLVYYDPATPAAPMVPVSTAPFTLSINGGGTQIVPITLPSTGVTSTGEIILFRSRGPIPVPGPANDPYNEGNIQENVPVDVVLTNAPSSTRSATVDWTVVQALIPVLPRSQSSRPLIQIFNDDFPGPYSPAASPSELPLTQRQFPFGGFARAGDVLKVPFIGSYRVKVTVGATSTFYYIPITMDCAACNTGVTGEQIGHFIPPTADPTTLAPAADYDWTKKIFDYFTAIQNPGSDYSPNVNPDNPTAGTAAGTSTTIPTAYSTWQTLTTTGFPNPIPNLSANAATPTVASTANVNNAYDAPTPNTNASNNEDNLGVDGLININTAPWQVLAALPMVPAGTTLDATTRIDDNMRLAKLIVQWRDGDATHPAHGPFKSIFDLNAVTNGVSGFQNAMGSFDPTAIIDRTSAFGDFSPITGSDGITTADFESKFNVLTRISNLITTRSDTFTCYVVVQGWLNAGSNTPILVSQQRMAFTANRVATGPGNATVLTTPLPAPP